MRTKHSHKIPRYAAFADDIDIDELEEAIGFEVLRTRGDEDIGKCPDYWGLHAHGDTTGKFAINRDKKAWGCFVCGGGGLSSLAMAHLDTTSEEDATEWLYQFASDYLYTKNTRAEKLFKLLEKEPKGEADIMPHFNARVLDQFNKEEDGEGRELLLEWLQNRGLTVQSVEDFHIGYSSRHKKPAPFKGTEKIDDDYYGPCLVFPHFWHNQLVGWQHRWLEWPNTPKWLGKITNTADFPKHTTLYNYDCAIKRAEPVVVVESVATTIFLESRGISSVASFGAGIASEQLRLLRAFDKVMVAPDNDKPGSQMAGKIVDAIKTAWVIPCVPGDGADLGDLSQRGEHPRDYIAEAIQPGRSYL